MQIKSLMIAACLPLCLSAQTVTINVIDDRGAAVEEATVEVTYEAIGSESTVKVGQTDATGRVSVSGNTNVGIWLRVRKDGYYNHGYMPAESDFTSASKLNNSFAKTIELPRIINPVPLYANLQGGGTLPAINEWCGYDLTAADWVAPYGKGDTIDILMRFQRKFVGFDKRIRHQAIEEERAFSKKAFAVRNETWTEEKFRYISGDWDLTLEIAFEGKKEGMIRVDDESKANSLLTMPHNAFAEGYRKSFRYNISTYGASAWKFQKNVGFFLRTRVVEDDDGNIESANFAKIHGDFHITVDGKVSFMYYFNPVPNDRNLEFDYSKNLLN